MDSLTEKMTLAVNDAIQDGTLEGDSSTPDSTTPDEVTSIPDEVTPDPAPETKVEPKDGKKDEGEDPLFKELGLTPRRDGKENRIPYSRTKAIAEKARKDGAAEAKLAAEAEFKATRDEHAEMKARLQAIGEIEDIIRNQPDRYVAELPNINPRYKELFRQAEQNVIAQAQATTPVISARPEPNVKLADGSMTYDLDGLQKLMDWKEQQVEARLDKKYEAQFGPIAKDYQDKKDYEKFLSVEGPKVAAQLDEAYKWDKFKENEDAILAELTSKTRPTASIHEAYQRVVFPILKKEREDIEAKAKVDKDKVRAELLAELKGAPTSLTLPAGSTAKPATADSLEDKMLAQLQKDGLVK